VDASHLPRRIAAASILLLGLSGCSAIQYGAENDSEAPTVPDLTEDFSPDIQIPDIPSIDVPDVTGDGSGSTGDDTTGDDAGDGDDPSSGGEPASALDGLETTDVVVTAGADYVAAEGEVDAAVTAVVFEDFLCPHCQDLTSDTLSQLGDLVDDGTLRIEYRPLMWLARESGDLARASWAAGQQGAYAEMHDELMNGAIPSNDVSDESLAALAEGLGLDADQFLADYDSDAAEQFVEDNNALADDLGMTGTPTSVIGEHVLPGAVDAARFRAVVEAGAAEG
jgi:protein-disulfide isomerase